MFTIYLLSFRYLNLAHNKIEKLPSDKDSPQWDGNGGKKKMKSSLKLYSAPLLEELYLQVGFN